MFPPLITQTDLDAYENPEAISSVFQHRSVWIAFTDDLARAIGHDDNYEIDGNGAAASTYPLTPTDRKLYGLAATLDFHRTRHMPYHFPHAFAYVSSDDRGFWDMIPCTATEAATFLAAWTEANVPTYCEACDCDTYGPSTTCHHCGAPL